MFAFDSDVEKVCLYESTILSSIYFHTLSFPQIIPFLFLFSEPRLDSALSHDHNPFCCNESLEKIRTGRKGVEGQKESSFSDPSKEKTTKNIWFGGTFADIFRIVVQMLTGKKKNKKQKNNPG